ncbi:SDR family oxidoreductase [Paenibacillus athensensis]|uniref:Short chain dehydrogenase n=1 Tax=Paenibacillus athensensis TaxID=1967502 RepID=A0A4Y8PRM5_9BACL|nr:oxidoreductase [Paenibacillus athensensis]MCD1261529.1 SDR family oxidoreductase [Paenibacillus athensensis]
MTTRSTRWTAADIPSQTGRRVVITGTGGLGYETALALLRAGAEVTLAGRNAGKGAEAVRSLRDATGSAHICFEELDLADLASVHAFAERELGRRDKLDLLINNAGVMTPPRRLTTKDGLELQWGTNFIGHFALTARLLPLLRQGDQPRVIHVSSIAHRNGTIHFDDLQSEISYKPMVAYSQSKLANLMFALELQRRSEAAGWGVSSLAAHPGIARTELLANGAGRWSPLTLSLKLMGPLMFQTPAQGALPTLFAATSPAAQGGGYYGPDGYNEVRGYPAPARIAPQAEDRESARRLWETAERQAGLSFI